MKYIVLITIAFLSLACEAQDVIFEEEYYSKISSRINVFRQTKDSLFLYSYRSNQGRSFTPRSKFKIIRDSIINDSTNIIFLRYKETKNNIDGENKLLIINYNNGRKGYKILQDEKRKKPEIKTLYPQSEFQHLTPIENLLDVEKQELMKDFIGSEKITYEQIDFDSDDFWSKLNSYCIKNGYNPFVE